MIKPKTTYGAFEAKTHLSRLLDRVEKGDQIVITRHGREVAVLSPIRDRRASPEERLAMIDRALASTKGTSLPKGATIRDLINEGRKWSAPSFLIPLSRLPGLWRTNAPIWA